MPELCLNHLEARLDSDEKKAAKEVTLEQVLILLKRGLIRTHLNILKTNFSICLNPLEARLDSDLIILDVLERTSSCLNPLEARLDSDCILQLISQLRIES